MRRSARRCDLPTAQQPLPHRGGSHAGASEGGHAPRQVHLHRPICCFDQVYSFEAGPFSVETAVCIKKLLITTSLNSESNNIESSHLWVSTPNGRQFVVALLLSKRRLHLP